MISSRKALLWLFFTVSLSISSSAAYAAAPIMLEGTDGKQYEFSEYLGKGKWTVLNIWGTRCPPCREEIPDLVHFHDAHKETDATVVGIAIDFPSYEYAKKNEVLAFADDYMIDFPLMLSDGYITQKLGLGRLEGLPTTYMYTPEGKLVGMQVGGITKEILEKYMKKYTEKQKDKGNTSQ